MKERDSLEREREYDRLHVTESKSFGSDSILNLYIRKERLSQRERLRTSVLGRSESLLENLLNPISDINSIALKLFSSRILPHYTLQTAQSFCSYPLVLRLHSKFAFE